MTKEPGGEPPSVLVGNRFVIFRLGCCVMVVSMTRYILTMKGYINISFSLQTGPQQLLCVSSQKGDNARNAVNYQQEIANTTERDFNQDLRTDASW
jgi:hypothetical protein